MDGQTLVREREGKVETPLPPFDRSPPARLLGQHHRDGDKGDKGEDGGERMARMVKMVMVADMEFVKNFTHPDFQAKNFTPQNCVIFDVFYCKSTAKMHQISIIWGFEGYK